MDDALEAGLNFQSNPARTARKVDRSDWPLDSDRNRSGDLDGDRGGADDIECGAGIDVVLRKRHMRRTAASLSSSSPSYASERVPDPVAVAIVRRNAVRIVAIAIVTAIAFVALIRTPIATATQSDGVSAAIGVSGEGGPLNAAGIFAAADAVSLGSATEGAASLSSSSSLSGWFDQLVRWVGGRANSTAAKQNGDDDNDDNDDDEDNDDSRDDDGRPPRDKRVFFIRREFVLPSPLPSTAEIGIARAGAAEECWVSWKTRDATAIAGKHYVSSAGILRWQTGHLEAVNVTVPIITNSTTIRTTTTMMATSKRGSSSSSSPSDTPLYFIMQLYRPRAGAELGKPSVSHVIIPRTAVVATPRNGESGGGDGNSLVVPISSSPSIFRPSSVDGGGNGANGGNTRSGDANITASNGGAGGSWTDRIRDAAETVTETAVSYSAIIAACFGGVFVIGVAAALYRSGVLVPCLRAAWGVAADLGRRAYAFVSGNNRGDDSKRSNAGANADVEGGGGRAHASASSTAANVRVHVLNVVPSAGARVPIAIAHTHYQSGGATPRVVAAPPGGARIVGPPASAPSPSSSRTAVS